MNMETPTPYHLIQLAIAVTVKVHVWFRKYLGVPGVIVCSFKPSLLTTRAAGPLIFRPSVSFTSTLNILNLFFAQQRKGEEAAEIEIKQAHILYIL